MSNLGAEVVRLSRKGLTAKQIADKLGCSTKSVYNARTRNSTGGTSSSRSSSQSVKRLGGLAGVISRLRNKQDALQEQSRAVDRAVEALRVVSRFD